MIRHNESADSPNPVLVSASNPIGEAFMHTLTSYGIPYAVITNNRTDEARLQAMGIERIWKVDTDDPKRILTLAYPIGNVYLMEENLPLCCRSCFEGPEKCKGGNTVLDLGMLALFVVLALAAAGIGWWADRVVEEGRGQA